VFEVEADCIRVDQYVSGTALLGDAIGPQHVGWHTWEYFEGGTQASSDTH
jgi:hypothetical protein